MHSGTHQEIVEFIRSLYDDGSIPLHRPVFVGNEKKYLIDCIDSNFVSSAGEMIGEFERQIARFTGAEHAVATVNGTAALHVALELAGVNRGEEVITQALSFIATCNALSYTGARPVFVDVDPDTLGLSPDALSRFLYNNVKIRNGRAYNKHSGRRIAACVPMHTFGHPCRIKEIADLCQEFGIELIEDAAESLGSYVGSRHTGTFGRMGTLSFNGNKVITTGGGGMILTNDSQIAQRAKHLTTTAKRPHPYEFVHDQVGYNYRLPNLNAALGCAQMEKLPQMIAVKREIAKQYSGFFGQRQIRFIEEPGGCTSNYWLNGIVLDDRSERDSFLAYSNEKGVMTRPIWTLMIHLPMFVDCEHDGLRNSRWLEDRVVNIPSSVPESRFGSLSA